MLTRCLAAAAVAVSLAAGFSAIVAAQGRQSGPQSVAHPGLSAAVLGFAKVDAALVALTNARVIDGSGAPPREAQTVIIKGRTIAAVGDTASLAAPEGATVIDLTGKTLIPGLIMVHEHLYYPTAPQVYAPAGQRFARLYLAGGVTTMGSGRNVNG